MFAYEVWLTIGKGTLVLRLTGILHFNRVTINRLKLFSFNRGSTTKEHLHRTSIPLLSLALFGVHAQRIARAGDRKVPRPTKKSPSIVSPSFSLGEIKRASRGEARRGEEKPIPRRGPGPSHSCGGGEREWESLRICLSGGCSGLSSLRKKWFTIVQFVPLTVHLPKCDSKHY